MKKLDLRRQLKPFYAPSARKIELVRLPSFRFAMIDGVIEPGQGPGTSTEFQQALQALYGVSYTLKFMSKLRAANPIDYPVMALEALWWTGAGTFAFAPDRPWRWTAMILQPDHVTPGMFGKAVAQLKEKRDSPAVGRLRLERFREGLCVQTMHVGPYADEPRTIERMRQFADQQGYVFSGKHHEIYLGDPRRAKPERLRTVLRHPLARPGKR